MAIVTFWNNNEGKTGQTYSTLAIATHMAIEHNYKILLLSTGNQDQVIMHAFGYDKTAKTVGILTGHKKSMDLESGIEGMTKLTLANRLSPELVTNYTKMVFKNRLEILTSTTNQSEGEMAYQKIFDSIPDILSVARRYYDVIIVDLNHGLSEEPTVRTLELSDIIVINLEQKMAEFEKMNELKEKNTKMFNPKKILTLINRYDRESKYSTKNLTRTLNEKKEILSVPYNILFAESVQEETTAEFFANSKIRKLEDSEDKTAFFINELARAEQAIIYKMQELQMRI